MGEAKYGQAALCQPSAFHLRYVSQQSIGLKLCRFSPLCRFELLRAKASGTQSWYLEGLREGRLPPPSLCFQSADMLDEECVFRLKELEFQANGGASHENNHEDNMPVPFPLPVVGDCGGLNTALLNSSEDMY